MTPVQRPLSPHLQIYKPQLTSVLSISHRATGLALGLGTILLVWWLVAAATSTEAFATAQWFFGSWIGLFLLFGWTYAFFYHLCNGIRHLLQDAGLGYQIHSRAKLNVNQATFVRSSWMSVIFSLILTIVAWVYVWQGVAA